MKRRWVYGMLVVLFLVGGWLTLGKRSAGPETMSVPDIALRDEPSSASGSQSIAPPALAEQDAAVPDAPAEASIPVGPAPGCLPLYGGALCPDAVHGFDEVLETTNRALRAGDFMGALRLHSLIDFCLYRVPRTETEMLAGVAQELVLDDGVYAAFPDSELGNLAPPPYFSQNRTLVDRVGGYDQALEHCEAVHAVLDQGLRRQVFQLAESGNAAAQFLLSLWRPGPFAGFDEQLAWRLKVEEYVEGSREQGGSDGLVIASWGYYLGIFKPGNLMAGWAHGKAAMQCGVDGSNLPGLHTRIAEQEVRRNLMSSVSQESLDAWVDALAAPCRRSD